MKLATQMIGTYQIDIEVSDSGQFSAEFNDEDFHAPTRIELFEQLKKAVKRADKVKPVEVTVLGLVPKEKRKNWDTEHFETGDGAVDAVLRGRHERNRTWLLTSVEGKQKFQVGSYSRDGQIVRRLTLEETMRYTKLLADRRVAATALEDFIGSVQIEPGEALAAARKAAD